jgi:polyhydroxybutyrate depolymerase
VDVIMLRSSFYGLLPILAAAIACSSEGDPAGVPVFMAPGELTTPAPSSGEPGDSAPSVDDGSAAEGTATASPSSDGVEGTPPIAGVQAPPAGGDAAESEMASGNTTAPTDDTSTPVEETPPSDMTAPGDTPAGATPITPSAGCGNDNPAMGQLSMTIRGNRADYLVTLPPNYSGTTPSPLIFGFHGRNRTYLEFEQVDASQIRTQLENRAVMVFPQSQGGAGWNFAAEVPPSLEFFEALYSQVVSNYCVDTSHTFAIGHSSGAYFADILACRYGDRLRGIGDVSGALQAESRDNCVGSVAALLVHGPNDTVVPFAGGVQMRDQYLSRNACSQMTIAGSVAPCVSYQGCAAGLPVAWCEHNEPTYQDQNGPTNHGWPSFATRAIADFLFALP